MKPSLKHVAMVLGALAAAVVIALVSFHAGVAFKRGRPKRTLGDLRTVATAPPAAPSGPSGPAR